MVLYRSWNKTRNYFIHFKNGSYLKKEPGKEYIETYSQLFNQYFSWDNAEQYTGLKDKNGIEIYEGDLIKSCENKTGYPEVVFVNAYVGGWVLKYKGCDDLSLGAREQNDLKIIGNIHQGIAVESDKENTV